jgi:predicted GIY-YIG superfamily endonuclease
MWNYVYILENEDGQHYVGLTENISERLAKHNRGEVSSTAKSIPWKLCHFSAFPTRKQAASYEKFLKTGSGREFRKRRLERND